MFITLAPEMSKPATMRPQRLEMQGRSATVTSEDMMQVTFFVHVLYYIITVTELGW
jgi:hypothetical protein